VTLVRPVSVLVLVVSVGCGPRPGGSTPPILAPAEARRGVEALLSEERAALAKGDRAQLAALAEPDGFFFGVEASSGGKLAEVAGTWDGEGRDLIGLSADGRAAWVLSELGEVRAAQVLVHRDGRWRIAGGHFSLGTSNDDAFTAAAAGTQPALREVTEAFLPVTQPAVDLFDAATSDLESFARQVADRDDVFLVGSDAAEVVTGGDKVKEILRKQPPGLTITTSRNGGVRAGVAGQVAWVAANMQLTATAPEERRVSVAYRALLVYTLVPTEEPAGEQAVPGRAPEATERWVLVGAHVSNGH
jgi:hypothetical protein